MAIDSAAKRRSAAYAGYMSIPPAPDGSVSQGDRQDVSWVYRGILATGLVIPDLVNYVAAYIAVSRPVARRL